MKIEENIQRIRLKDISRKNPMKVPDGYFEKLENQILRKTVQTQQPTKIRYLSRVWKISIAAAASLIILLGLKILLDEREYNTNQKTVNQNDIDIVIDIAIAEASLEAIPNMEAAINDYIQVGFSNEQMSISDNIYNYNDIKSEDMEEYYDKYSYFSIFTEL